MVAGAEPPKTPLAFLGAIYCISGTLFNNTSASLIFSLGLLPVLNPYKACWSAVSI